ncbi:hypothetical protein [Pararhizobium antarcticum]|uniref:hypothetical protein n=1 Tax=Pararhizobium antarcticum TaxID=1798805 RepID=UPI001587748E|nr:hypothetical protein [Pararhizobium antarcticum]
MSVIGRDRPHVWLARGNAQGIGRGFDRVKEKRHKEKRPETVGKPAAVPASKS